MTTAQHDRPETEVGAEDLQAGGAFSPLPGEPGIPDVAGTRSASVSRKGLLAVGLLVTSLIAASVFGIQRFSALGKRTDQDGKPVRDRPAAATVQTRQLEMPAPASAVAPGLPPRIPALVAVDEETAEPIGVRRTGGGPAGIAAKGGSPLAPEDAPVLIVSTRPGPQAAAGAATRTVPGPGTADASMAVDGGPGDALAATARNLQAYQRQLQGTLENLSRSAEMAPPGPWDASPPPPVQPGDAQLPAASHAVALPAGSGTPRVMAAQLGNRSLTLARGTAFSCVLKTRLVSATSGLLGCQVQRHVYSDDGRVLLIERGSHLDGEYRITSLRPGVVRIPVLWTRIRTPLGVTVDIESPGTGMLGESGIDGHVDNRWWERIGAAMLLSLIDDAVKLVIQDQSSDRQAGTVILPSSTSNTSKLAEKVLDSTINTPPLIYRNQGGVVGIYVARDVDFSTVYELVPTAGLPMAR